VCIPCAAEYASDCCVFASVLAVPNLVVIFGLQDPSKFAVAAPVAAADSSAAAPKEEEKAPEPAEESDEEMGFSLFDD
jgi:hypothetical protein